MKMITLKTNIYTGVTSCSFYGYRYYPVVSNSSIKRLTKILNVKATKKSFSLEQLKIKQYTL